MPRKPKAGLSPKLRKYLSEIGAKGGKKSKRTLSKSEAKQMAVKRWTTTKQQKTN